MSFSKNLASYPQNMGELCRLMQGLTKPVSITYATSAEATKTRHYYYGYAGALEYQAEKHGLPDYLSLANGMRAVEVRKDGATLTFTSRLDTASYAGIAKLISVIRDNGEETAGRVAAAEKRVEHELAGVDPMEKHGYTSHPHLKPVAETTKEPEDAYTKFMGRTDNEDKDRS